jgi:hypothetical protein
MFEFGSNTDWHWDGNRRAVLFTVSVNGQPITCRVSESCIMDHFGQPSTETKCLAAAKERFDPITDLAADLIHSDRFEADGTVLISSADWERKYG